MDTLNFTISNNERHDNRYICILEISVIMCNYLISNYDIYCD